MSDKDSFKFYTNRYAVQTIQFKVIALVTIANLVIWSCLITGSYWWASYSTLSIILSIVYVLTLYQWVEDTVCEPNSIYNGLFKRLKDWAYYSESSNIFGFDFFEVWGEDDIVCIRCYDFCDCYYRLEYSEVRTSIPKRKPTDPNIDWASKKTFLLKNLDNDRDVIEISFIVCDWERKDNRVEFQHALISKRMRVISVFNKYGDKKWSYHENQSKRKESKNRIWIYRAAKVMFGLFCVVYSLLPIALMYYFPDEAKEQQEELVSHREAYENRKALYEALSYDYDWDSYEDFDWWLSKEQNRRRLYKATVNDYDYGSYSEFSESLGY